MDFDKVKDKIENFKDRQEAINNVKKEGLRFPARVEIPEQFLEGGMLKSPENVHELPSGDLGYHLNTFTQLAAYYRAVVAALDIDYTEAKRVAEYTEAMVMKKLSEEKTGETVTELKSIRDTHELVLKAKEKKDKKRANYKMAEAILEGVNDYIFLISREITRSGTWSMQEGREEKVYTRRDNKR